MDTINDPGNQGHEPIIVPPEILFARQKEQARLSPDGRWLAYLGPSPDDVLNVWVRPLHSSDEEAKMLTAETRQGVRWYIWNPSAEYIIYKVDNGGREDWVHYSIEVATGAVKVLTPPVGVHSKLIPSSIIGQHPDEMLFCMNMRDPSEFDAYKVNIKTGEAALDTQNPGDVSVWLCDSNAVIRGALAFNLSDGSSTIRVRDSVDSPWHDVLHWTSLDSGSMAGFGPSPKQMYVMSSIDSPTTRLLLINTNDGSINRVIASDPKSDIMPLRHDPSKVLLMDFRIKEYVAVAFIFDKLKWKVLHPSVEEDYELLTSFKAGQMTIGSRDRSNQNYKLGKVHPHVLKSRDGLDILVYLTLPPRIQPKNLPMVLRIHGGPWYRDWWGWDAENQFWATRGYACLQVQYRGSDGFGKAFLHAGDKQWAAAMQDDITDSVYWAVAEGYADKERIGITGISYGGFSTLAGITFTPGLYKCAAELVGPSQLFTVTTYIVPYWKSKRKLLNDRVVDLRQDEEMNKTRSPIFHVRKFVTVAPEVEKIRVPLIMAHGRNDVIVNPGESERLFQALKAKGKAVQYIIYEDEGHHLERPQNKMDWYNRVGALFHKHLGGQIGPIPVVTSTGAHLVADLINT